MVAEQRAGRERATEREPAGEGPCTTLYHFLLQFRVEKGCEHTHTSFARPSGAFYIPGQRFADFMALYKAAIARGEDVFLTERHRAIGPVLVDLDFRWDLAPGFPGTSASATALQTAPQRRYTPEAVEGFARLYCSKLAKYVAPQVFDVYVLEKPAGPTVQKNLLKDGVHIEIPGVVTRPAVQYLVRQDVLAEAASVFSALGLANRYEDVVDEAIIERNNWLMYGAKKPNGAPYVVTRVLRYSAASGQLSDVTAEFNIADTAALVDRLAIRNKFEETPLNSTSASLVADYEQQLEERRKRKELVQTVMANTPCTANNTTCDNLETVGKLVDVLDKARGENYNDWVRVGWCLRNIDHRLLDKWIEFSRQSPKYVEGECARMWTHMRMGGLGIGTLHMWARKDSPERYKEIIRTDLSELINKSASGTHCDIALVVHAMYRYEYVCASIRCRSWYEFRSHRWHSCDSACSLRKKLSNEVYREYTQAALWNQQRAVAVEEETEQKRHMEVCTKMNAIALKLKDTNFKDNIIKECCELFYHEKFEEKLDSNCGLVGFLNGVYDLDNSEFREGRPDDYISFTTGINYVAYSEDLPHLQDIKRFWSQVLPNEDIREYVLTLLASFLSGYTREERFHIWTGSGCHEKGTQIMMYDGSTKNVEDIDIGDVLMGDDSTPRNVLKLHRGRADMWRVTPVKGQPFVVNGEHTLSFKMSHTVYVCRNKRAIKKPWTVYWYQWDRERIIVSRSAAAATQEDAQIMKANLEKLDNVVKSGDVVNISVKNLVDKVPKYNHRLFNLYRPDFVEFEAKPIHADLDPYVLGVWLGDGTTIATQITSMDAPIVDKVRELLPPTVKMVAGKQKKGRALKYGISKADGVGRKRDKNDFTLALESYGLLGNKHIPLEYRCNTKDVRMRVLAGLLDTDGHYQAHTNQYELTLKSECLLDDAISLARSLGFACYKAKIQKKCCNNGKVGTYFRTQIVGPGIQDIPVQLEYKKARTRVKAKDVHRVGIKLEKVTDDGEYFGFEVDANHLFLMGDYTAIANSNGKSLSVELYDKAMGDYTCKFPVTLLTQKRAASNSATSEIARAKGRRFACLQEPSEDERLNIGLLKELTGGDKVQARAIYKEPVEFKPQWHIALLCNHLPHVPSDDGGTWRRIRVVEFTSKFVEKPVHENEFPVDLELSQKLDDWKEPFMSFLVEHYRVKYRGKKIKEPEQVMKCTREYQKNNDHYADFVDTCLERAPEEDKEFLTVTDAFAEFRGWVRDDNIPVKMPRKKELQKYLDRALCKPVSQSGELGYPAWQMKNRVVRVAGGGDLD